MPKLNCVDMSRWGGELTADEAREMVALGIRRIIVGTGHPNGAGMWARQQADAWLAAGGEQLDAYVYLYFGGSPEGQCVNAVQTLGGLHILRWWLDAEDVDSPELTPDQRATFLRRCVRIMDAFPLGIYTGRWWWVPNMENSTEFSYLPLWNSWYDGDPDVDGVPYGGWTTESVAVEQYQGTTLIAGQSVDLNWAYDMEDDMTPAERARLERLERLVAANGYRVSLETVLTGEPAMAAADADGGSLFLGLGDTQAALGKHLHPVENGATVPPHAHKTSVQTIISGREIIQ